MVEAQIQNLNKLISQLENISTTAVKKALNNSCLVVENEAKVKCPVQTSQLRQSITHEVENNEGYIGTNVEYAPYVEFGTGLFSSKGDGRTDVPWMFQDDQGRWWKTSGQKPQPYLLPALENNRNEIINIFKTAIKESL